ncbi:MAG: homocysteine S-methyltransferase family protein [Gemmatimonadales bacterium]|nr:homocysteine S-methyltransferase family protein [Gemmatimonadales bacterium]
MGTELRARGVRVRDYKSSLWSALACLEAPDAVTQLHRDYIDAGADIITVNNYAVTPVLLAREGMEDAFKALTESAGQCALAARDSARRSVRVAGSLPPLNTTFDASLVGDFDDNVAGYRRIVAALNPFVDLYLCETVATAEEARAAAVAAQESGKPFIVSWTIERTGQFLRGGDSFARAVKRLEAVTPDALLVNCTSCNAVSAAIRRLRELTDLPIGGYANPVLDEPEGGEPERVISAPIGPDEYAAVAKGWVEDGATIIGGCCGTNPDFTAALRRIA